MPNLTSVHVTSGAPDTGTGNVSTLDAFLAALSAGTAPSLAAVVAGQYNSTVPTLTNGQTAASQLDIGGGNQVVGNRRVLLRQTRTSVFGQTTYSGTGLCLGGLFSIATGLPQGLVVPSLTVLLKILIGGSAPTITSGVALAFDANPSGSTFTDNSQMALVAADVPKVCSFVGATLSGNAGSFSGSYVQLSMPFANVPIGASGNIWYALIGNATTNWPATVYEQATLTF